MLPQNTLKIPFFVDFFSNDSAQNLNDFAQFVTKNFPTVKYKTAGFNSGDKVRGYVFYEEELSKQDLLNLLFLFPSYPEDIKQYVIFNNQYVSDNDIEENYEYYKNNKQKILQQLNFKTLTIDKPIIFELSNELSNKKQKNLKDNEINNQSQQNFNFSYVGFNQLTQKHIYLVDNNKNYNSIQSIVEAFVFYDLDQDVLYNSLNILREDISNLVQAAELKFNIKPYLKIKNVNKIL